MTNTPTNFASTYFLNYLLMTLVHAFNKYMRNAICLQQNKVAAVFTHEVEDLIADTNAGLLY